MPGPSTRPREPLPFRTVAIGLGVLGAAIVAVAVGLYLRFVRYERIAGRHVPANAVVVLRLDVEQALLYEPFRKHLLPLLGGPSAPAPEGDARLARVERRVRLSRGDLREVVVARGPAAGDWTLSLGGVFQSGPGTADLGRALSEVDALWAPSPDGSAIVHGATGVAVARAPDGVVVLGASVPLLAAALAPKAPPPAGVPGGRAGGFALGPAMLDELRSFLGASGPAGLAVRLRDVRAASGEIHLGERITLSVRLEATPPAAPLDVGRALLAVLRGYSHADPSPWPALAREGADRGGVQPDGEGAARLDLTWEREEVDRAFAALAEAIRSS